MMDSLKGQTKINLVDQYIGDEGSRLLGRVLAQNQNLTQLELKGNNIGSEGIIDIIEGLRGNDNLRVLCLMWNSLGQDKRGLEAIAGYLL